MNSINKIGVMALTKVFFKKTFVSNERTFSSEVIFSKQEIDPKIMFREDGHKSYKIWSIELGIIELFPKANQNLYAAIIRTLEKQQREDVPSHLIISEVIGNDNSETTTHTIYRFTEEQELTMYFQDLMPSIDKRWKAIQTKTEKYHAEYLAWCAEFEKSLEE